MATLSLSSSPVALHRIRQARPPDAAAIAGVIRPFAADGLMLPRSEGVIARQIHEYRVAESVESGAVVGSVAIRPFNRNLADIIAFAVASGWQGKGIGVELLEGAVEECLLRGFERVFAMTMRPGIFQRLGFEDVPRELVPEKIRRDCRGCPFRVGCRERTMLLDVRSASAS